MKSEYRMKLIGSDSAGETGIDSIILRKPIAFVLGNEAKGMSVNLRTMCDSIIKIPSFGDVNSLNVSCAGSIVLWEIFKNSRSPERLI
jgi:23S rRNA (uridine2479-2'-O)-methyltransferase